jgi:hypothetical protein
MVAYRSSWSAVAVVRVDTAIGVSHAVCAVRHRRSALVRISRIAWAHAKCALKTANDTTNDTSHHCTNRSSRVVTNIGAMGSPVGYPLRAGG